MSGPSLIPPGPGANNTSVLKSFFDALMELRQPGAPSQLAHVDTVADLTSRFNPADHQGGVLICDEIHSMVHSTLISGSWVWKRADGSAL